jgi:glycosyltransferase involved in cell wall biosynthesis
MYVSRNGSRKSNDEGQIEIMPQISVCMATCNGERFISQQLFTILPQLSSDDEVIVSDDSSVDRTVEIIESFNDKRIRLFRNQTFRSPTYNFENALKHARGEIIFLSDQDDEWVEGWVKTACAELKGVSLVVCDAYMVDSEGKLFSDADVKIYHGVRKPGTLRNLYRNGYIGCCCAFRREILEVVLPFPSKLPWHDWWIGLVADSFFSTKFLRDKFIRYRRHENNVSTTGGKSSFTLWSKIRMRSRIGFALLRLKAK